MGLNPGMVANLSWYKAMEYSYAEIILEEFESKRHLLLSYEFKDSFRDREKNIALLADLRKFRDWIREFNRSRDFALIENIRECLGRIAERNVDLGRFFTECILECVTMLEKPLEISAEKIANMPNLCRAWGRGQQYISFMYKGDL